MKVVWRGTADEATEMYMCGRTWITHEPQDVLTEEESLKQLKDGWYIEESLPEIAPNGTRILVTKQRWLSIVEMAKRHPYFDVEGEEPKKIVKPRKLKPGEYPNAAMEGERAWVPTEPPTSPQTDPWPETATNVRR